MNSLLKRGHPRRPSSSTLFCYHLMITVTFYSTFHLSQVKSEYWVRQPKPVSPLIWNVFSFFQLGWTCSRTVWASPWVTYSVTFKRVSDTHLATPFVTTQFGKGSNSIAETLGQLEDRSWILSPEPETKRANHRELLWGLSWSLTYARTWGWALVTLPMGSRQGHFTHLWEEFKS